MCRKAKGHVGIWGQSAALLTAQLPKQLRCGFLLSSAWAEHSGAVHSQGDLVGDNPLQETTGS